MRDTIYREDAIKVLEELSACEDYGVEIGTDEETYIGKYEAITEISDLPSVNRPQGEWVSIIEVNDFGEPYQAGIYCSECGETFGHETNFCPYCGADMR